MSKKTPGAENIMIAIDTERVFKKYMSPIFVETM